MRTYGPHEVEASVHNIGPNESYILLLSCGTQKTHLSAIPKALQISFMQISSLNLLSDMNNIKKQRITDKMLEWIANTIIFLFKDSYKETLDEE